MKEMKNYIGGRYIPSITGETFEVFNPANGKVVGTAQRNGRQDAHIALQAAKGAQKAWAALPAQKRAEYLYAFANELENASGELARLLSQEQGKPLAEAGGEMAGSVNFIRYAAESARRIEGDILSSENQNEQVWIQRVPYGVVVGLCAWNFPVALACRKIGGALVCGNTMVVKPPSETPLAAMMLGECASRAGIPAGVLNLITGDGATVGDELVRNPVTSLVTLTGSTDAGRKLYEAAAENIAVLRLELGGKAPFIVMDDADVDYAVQEAIASRFGNCGQICTCNERMYVHENVYDAFLSRFMQRASQLVVGDPMDPATDIGPKVSLKELEKLEVLLQRSVEQGGRVLLGGGRATVAGFEGGHWFEPTVVEIKDNSNILMQEEIFGPIAPIMKISSFDEAIQYANECRYGLSAYLFTNNVRYIMRMVQELEFGEVYVNRRNGELVNAFHNGYKLSGVGGEDGRYGLEGYMQKKTVYMNYDK